MNNPDQEVDLIELLRTIWKSKWLIITGAILGGALAFGYNVSTPPRFTAVTTFFFPSETNSQISNVSQLLGGGGASNLKDILPALIESSKMRTMVAKDMMPLLSIKTVAQTRGRLKLEKGVKLSLEKSVYRLSYESENPQLIVPVLNCYIQDIEKLNQELELGSKRDFMTILDPPEEPKFPSKPNKRFNLFIGVLFGVVLGTLGAIWRQYRAIKQL